MKRKYDYCNKEYSGRKTDIDIGLGLCCSKSCAASKREEVKVGYNKETVAKNNIRQKNWNSPDNPKSEYYRTPTNDQEYDDTTYPFSSEGLGQD